MKMRYLLVGCVCFGVIILLVIITNTVELAVKAILTAITITIIITCFVYGSYNIMRFFGYDFDDDGRIIKVKP